jgi:AraC-like DNA-binding protein
MLDPLLLHHLIPAILAAVSAEERGQCAGILATPLTEWRGRDVIELFDRLVLATADDFMGLGAAPCAPGSSEFLVELSTRCDTLRDSIRCGARFMGLVTHAIHVELLESSDQAVIEISHQPSAGDGASVLGDLQVIGWHKRSQWLIGAEILLQRAEFAHPLQTRYSSYADMFGGHCIFNTSASRLVFARSYLDQPVIRTPADAERLWVRKPGYFARPRGLSRSWKQRVKDVLRVEIAKGKDLSTIDDLAAGFGVSSPTLRRRLASEGAGYRSLKAEARQEIVLDVLANGSATVSQASMAAGFAEPGALYRALKSKGSTPAQLRDQIKRWSGGGLGPRHLDHT